MICCESCNDWFHGTCVHLEESDEPLIDKYTCPICTDQGKSKTTWRRKCRLEGCKNPSIPAVRGVKGGAKGIKGSKYCSDEHGTLFFQAKLRELDDDIMTKEQLKSLVMAVDGVDGFKTLGDEEPVIPESVLLKYKSGEDDSRLADLRLEREKLLRKLEIVHLRQTFLHLAVEKAKQLNIDLKSLAVQPQQLTVGRTKPKSKAKEICGFNEILSLDETEFLDWSVTEEGKRIFAEKRIAGDKECVVEKRRCRHTGWQGLRGEDILMEESLLNSQLEGISRQENVIRYFPMG
jgi:COMPASS component SPP1